MNKEMMQGQLLTTSHKLTAQPVPKQELPSLSFQPKRWCGGSAVVVTNPKYSTVQTAVKKTDSIPAVRWCMFALTELEAIGSQALGLALFVKQS